MRRQVEQPSPLAAHPAVKIVGFVIAAAIIATVRAALRHGWLFGLVLASATAVLLLFIAGCVAIARRPNGG